MHGCVLAAVFPKGIDRVHISPKENFQIKVIKGRFIGCTEAAKQREIMDMATTAPNNSSYK